MKTFKDDIELAEYIQELGDVLRNKEIPLISSL